VTDERVTIEALAGPPVAARRLELVERKGLGHPDTICDSVAEAISLGLNRLYLQRVGAILHYNVDKALLIAGQCTKGFGWGELSRPMELVVGDRATLELDGLPLPVEETAQEAVEGWLARHLPHIRPGVDLGTRVALASGSAQLRRIVGPADGEIVANDTAGASGYAPLSPTEALTLAVERYLNGQDFKDRFPETGQDVKVLAVRRDVRVALTVAMPLLARSTASERAYFERKEAVLAALAARFGSAPLEIDWRLQQPRPARAGSRGRLPDGDGDLGRGRRLWPGGSGQRRQRPPRLLPAERG
jgi:S-adenosylmethionine synthetase